MLARNVTKWTVADDKRLHRLMSYIHHTYDHVMYCSVGDTPEKCKLMLFADASFAGNLKDSKSTSGCIVCLVGPNTFVPIGWQCKKQTAVSHSSSEAEIVSLDAALRLEGLPCLDLWDLVIDVLTPQSLKEKMPDFLPGIAPHELPPEYKELSNVDYVPPNIKRAPRRATIILLEDNDAVIKMLKKGMHLP